MSSKHNNQSPENKRSSNDLEQEEQIRAVQKAIASMRADLQDFKRNV
jgi:hypothetical protein